MPIVAYDRVQRAHLKDNSFYGPVHALLQDKTACGQELTYLFYILGDYPRPTPVTCKKCLKALAETK